MHQITTIVNSFTLEIGKHIVVIANGFKLKQNYSDHEMTKSVPIIYK